MESLKVKFSSVAPMLQHNGQLSDPLNPFSKAMKQVTSKRTKTDDDFQRLADLEWEGGLYTDSEGRVIIPSALIEGAITGAARKQKLGKVVQSGVFVHDDSMLEFADNSKTVEELRDDHDYRLTTSVKVGMNRVMRTRPKFDDWSAETVITFDPEQINREQLVEIVTTAGDIIGLGDWRPKYGRFEVEIVK